MKQQVVFGCSSFLRVLTPHNTPPFSIAALKMLKTSFILFLFIVLFGSCEDEGVPTLPSHVSTVQLTMEEVGVTDVWLKLKFADLASPRDFVLRRGSTTVLSGHLIGRDTLLLDTSAAPGASYNYVALRLNGITQVDSSTRLQVTTLDTTSHEGYAWAVDTLGDGNSSVLFDVAIINDTLAYAVGRISLRDSTGQFDPIPYSMAVWNGSNWQLKRLYYSGNNLIAPIRGISVFGPNDIWLAAGSVFHWDGVSSQAQLSFSRLILPDPNATIEKLWGSTSSNLWGVGNVGTIVWYDGSTWQAQQSGTSINLTDVSGNADGSKVWAAGYQSDLSRSVVLEYNGQQWRTIRDIPASLPRYSDSLSGVLTSVWAYSKRYIVAASSAGMYWLQEGSHGEARATWLPDPFSVGFFLRVRGSNRNNAFVVGQFGMVAHFNGVSWFLYPQFFNFSGYPILYGVSVTERSVMAVGYSGDRAIVIRGRK